MVNANFMPRGRNIMTVKVVSYKDSCIKGILNCPQFEDDIEFMGAIPLLLRMEQIMDESNCPQRGEEPRNFGVDSRLVSFSDKNAQKAEDRRQAIATFQINVMFRQNATWQGRLLWIDENMEASFRSVLELIRLLDSALAAKSE